jgi:hypothetical protein
MSLPEPIQRSYAALDSMKLMMVDMKANQAMRGEAGLRDRLAKRASTHQTWRQMSGVKLFMHEVNHPGVKPFVIGFG